MIACFIIQLLHFVYIYIGCLGNKNQQGPYFIHIHQMQMQSILLDFKAIDISSFNVNTAA